VFFAALLEHLNDSRADRAAVFAQNAAEANAGADGEAALRGLQVAQHGLAFGSGFVFEGKDQVRAFEAVAREFVDPQVHVFHCLAAFAGTYRAQEYLFHSMSLYVVSESNQLSRMDKLPFYQVAKPYSSFFVRTDYHYL
jgi:hypothetical protein